MLITRTVCIIQSIKWLAKDAGTGPKSFVFATSPALRPTQSASQRIPGSLSAGIKRLISRLRLWKRLPLCPCTSSCLRTAANFRCVFEYNPLSLENPQSLKNFQRFVNHGMKLIENLACTAFSLGIPNPVSLKSVRESVWQCYLQTNRWMDITKRFSIIFLF